METDNKYLNKANLAIVIGAIAIFVTILLYVLNIKDPELTFYVNPEKSIVAQPIDASSLQILHNGKIINEKIVLAQVTFWNAGRKPVFGKTFKENGDIVDEFQLYVVPKARVIDARITKASRDGINFVIAQNQLDAGIIPLKWDVLGKGDGVKLQIAYIDKENAEIKIRGSIIEQDKIKEYSSPRQWKFDFWIFIYSGIFMFIFMYSGLYDYLQAKIQIHPLIIIKFLIIMMFILIIIIYFMVLLDKYRLANVPFGP